MGVSYFGVDYALGNGGDSVRGRIARGNEGMTETQLSYFYLVGGAVTLFTRPLFGSMSDRFSRAKLYYWLVLASIVPMILISHTLGVSMFWQLFVGALFFIFVSGRFVPVTALITSAARPQTRGRLMSFNSAVSILAPASQR